MAIADVAVCWADLETEICKSVLIHNELSIVWYSSFGLYCKRHIQKIKKNASVTADL